LGFPTLHLIQRSGNMKKLGKMRSFYSKDRIRKNVNKIIAKNNRDNQIFSGDKFRIDLLY